MRLRSKLARWLYVQMMFVADARHADVTIGGEDNPYLRRWFIIPRNPIFNIYLHQFLRSDDDRALHDHPWLNVSFLLHGRYVEHTIAKGGINHRVERQAGDYKFRGPRSAHRVELIDGDCWTLFITGPRIRTWGFHCPNGWVAWQIFTNPSDGGRTIGPGCDAAPNIPSLAHNKTPSEHAGTSA